MMNLLDELEYDFNLSSLQADGTLYSYDKKEIVLSSQEANQQILDWCHDREIDADIIWSGRNFCGDSTVCSVWGIKDETQRTMFALRWT